MYLGVRYCIEQLLGDLMGIVPFVVAIYCVYYYLVDSIGIDISVVFW